jgi:hypothetical protein
MSPTDLPVFSKAEHKVYPYAITCHAKVNPKSACPKTKIKGLLLKNDTQFKIFDEQTKFRKVRTLGIEQPMLE